MKNINERLNIIEKKLLRIDKKQAESRIKEQERNDYITYNRIMSGSTRSLFDKKVKKISFEEWKNNLKINKNKIIHSCGCITINEKKSVKFLEMCKKHKMDGKYVYIALQHDQLLKNKK